MRRLAQSAAALVLFTIASTTLGYSQQEPQIPLSWFEEPERHASHWKVEFGSDLNFNQRFWIGIFASLPALKKNDPRPVLHFAVRVADEHGNFFDGFDYTRFDTKLVPADADHITWHTNFYVQPAIYTVVLLVYDESANQHYLWRETVKISRPKSLPDLDRDLPQVEFVNPQHRHAPTGERLPIQNQRPLRVDIILNLSGDQQLRLAPGFFSRMRQFSVEAALVGTVSVLSQMHPANGCVRTSAIDILHLRVARDRGVADPNVDWQQTREAIMKNRDMQTVDVKTLAGRQKAREFFRQYIDKVIADDTGCADGGPSPDRAVIVVSDALEFPKGTDKEHVAIPEERGGSFYHLRITLHTPTFDQVGHMLDPLHPRRFDIGDPKDLRRAIAEMIHELEQASASKLQ